MDKEELLAKNDIKKFIAKNTLTVFHEMPRVLAKAQLEMFVCQRRSTIEGKVDALRGLAYWSEEMRDMADEIFERVSRLNNEWQDVGFEYDDDEEDEDEDE